jgi:hypothetical protein
MGSNNMKAANLSTLTAVLLTKIVFLKMVPKGAPS